MATTYRNSRSGEEVSTELTRQEIATRFAETAPADSWLWYWLAQHAERQRGATAAGQDMIAFLADSFLFAIGMGLKAPMIRLHFAGRRYKIYLSKRGTLCFKSGATNGTDPIGDEEYVGCLYSGRFLPNKERTVLPVEGAFLQLLSADPPGFLAKCSRDMDRCCYCALPLEDVRSKDVGYGPVCAVRWGLPWGKGYNEKVPSFASLWAGAAAEDRRSVRAVCEGIRRAPFERFGWDALGDILEDVGYAKRPACPMSGVTIPAGV